VPERILLVDDNAAVATSLKMVLDTEGSAITLASSTPETISALHN
jgi:CheY-like chemotaxis protein